MKFLGLSGKAFGVIVVALAICGAMGYLIGTTNAPKSGGFESVTFNLGWIVDGTSAPFFVAKDMGYFAEEGLVADIFAGSGSGDTASRIELRQCTFGVCDTETVIISASQGSSIKTIGMLYTKNPLTIFSLAESGITTLKDMEGHSLALTDPEEEQLLRELCRLNGVDYSKLNVMVIDPSAVYTLMLAGQIDLTQGYITDFLTYCQLNDISLNLIRYADWGLPLYSDGLITNKELIQENPDLVRRFLRAVYRGWDYAIDHRDEATDMLIKYSPELNWEEARLILDTCIDNLFIPDQYKEVGLGYVFEDKMQTTIDLVNDLIELENPVQTSDVYTNDLLPGIMPS